MQAFCTICGSRVWMQTFSPICRSREWTLIQNDKQICSYTMYKTEVHIQVIVYGVYILLAFYGCSQLQPNLTPSRLVVDDSPLVHYLHLAENKIWAEGLIGRVYVNRAPDIKNPHEVWNVRWLISLLKQYFCDIRPVKFITFANVCWLLKLLMNLNVQVKRMLGLVLDLESTPYSMGPNSTSFWLNDFNNYMQYFSEDNDR